MAAHPSTLLKPRKLPIQARALTTVDAIFDATIQVLTRQGSGQLTTTRVADRAGVSVGTLYQYYPNKHALLYAVLQRHLARMADIFEQAAHSAHGSSLSQMVAAAVGAFVNAKTERIDEVRAFYDVADELNAMDLIAEFGARNSRTVSAMLATTPSVRFDDLALTSQMFCLAMTGPVSAIFQRSAPTNIMRSLPAQLESLCLGYLEREAVPA